MRILSKFEELFIEILLVILVVFTFVNVLLRYVFSYSIMGSVEFSIMLFAWIIFVGSSMAIRSGSHIRINLLDSFMGKGTIKVLSNIISIVILIVCLYMCYYGTILTFKVFGETLGGTNVPKAYVYFSFPVGFGLSSIHLIYQLVTSFKLKEGKK